MAKVVRRTETLLACAVEFFVLEAGPVHALSGSSPEGKIPAIGFTDLSR